MAACSAKAASTGGSSCEKLAASDARSAKISPTVSPPVRSGTAITEFCICPVVDTGKADCGNSADSRAYCSRLNAKSGMASLSSGRMRAICAASSP